MFGSIADGGWDVVPAYAALAERRSIPTSCPRGAFVRGVGVREQAVADPSIMQNPTATPAPDRVNRDFTVPAPDRLWAADA